MPQYEKRRRQRSILVIAVKRLVQLRLGLVDLAMRHLESIHKQRWMPLRQSAQINRIHLQRPRRNGHVAVSPEKSFPHAVEINLGKTSPEPSACARPDASDQPFALPIAFSRAARSCRFKIIKLRCRAASCRTRRSNVPRMVDGLRRNGVSLLSIARSFGTRIAAR